MKKRYAFYVCIIIVALVLAAGCSSGKSSSGDGPSAPTQTAAPKATPDINSDVNPTPVIHENYIPVQGKDIEEVHVVYPDWSKIQQPEIPELDALKNTPGLLMKLGEPVWKEYDEAYGTETFYDRNEHVVMTVYYSSGEPERKIAFEYYANGAKFANYSYDMSMEGRPESFYVYDSEGNELISGSYSFEGHLSDVTLYENGVIKTGRAYYDSALLKTECKFYEGMVATKTDYFESGEINEYTEYDTAGDYHYVWTKNYTTGNDYLVYYISEREDNLYKYNLYHISGSIAEKKWTRFEEDGTDQLLLSETYYYDDVKVRGLYYSETYDEDNNRFVCKLWEDDGTLTQVTYKTNDNGMPGSLIE